jgi:glutathione S-transferase
VFGRKTDEALLKKATDVEIPQVLDYLETQLPAEGFLFGDLSVADISIAVFFRNAKFARYTVDAARWPKTAAFVERVLAQECLARLRPFEEKILRTPIAQHRAALAGIGVSITQETYGTDKPRVGLMRI